MKNFYPTDAHYDTNTGAPAAFWELKNVEVGDIVYVKDEKGKFYEYVITQSFFVDISDPNRLDVLSQDVEGSLLTMITCGGVWLPSHGTYDSRLVVRAELSRDLGFKLPDNYLAFDQK